MGLRSLSPCAVLAALLLGGCPSEEARRLPETVDLVLGDGPEARAYRLDVGSQRLAPLAPAPSYPYGETPSGGALLGVADDIVLRAPGGALRAIAASPGLDWHPRLHPDGRRLLFESSRDSFRDLYLTFLDDPSRVVRLTNDPEGNFDGAWSPSGDRICFSSSRFGQLDLFVMGADGARPTRWTRHAGDAVRCAFAPSGRSIAYVSARDGRDDVLLARSADAAPKNLTRGLGPEGASVRRFVWHPREDRLLVALGPPGSVWVVGDGAPRRLTPEGARDAEPAWSPDGRRVLLVREGDPSGLVVVDPESGGTTALHPSSSAWRPRWRRAPRRTRNP